jgi:hypothetical protein
LLVFQDAVIFQLRAQEVQLQVVDLLAYLVVSALVMKFNKKPVTETPLELTLPIVQLLLLPPQAGLVTLQ